MLTVIRARAVLHLKVVRPMQFFTNSKEVGYSPADMGPVADSLYELLCDLEADGSKGMDIGLDVFKAVGDSPEDASPEQRAKDQTTKEAYKSWKLDYLKRQGQCTDASAKVPMWQLAVAGMFDPGVR